MTKTQVTHVTETITPELAQKYLDSNRLNRPLKQWRIDMLVNDMLAGNWTENGEAGVTFDWNGNIAGGQHTLNAVVKSGTSVRLRVTRGVDPAARATMNDSLKQRFSDDLNISGVPDARYAEPLVRKVIVWESVAREFKGYGGLASWRNTRMSRAQLAAEWPTYAVGINNTLHDSHEWSTLWSGVGNRGAMHLFWWVLTEKYGFELSNVEKFFSRVIYGSQSSTDKVLFQKLGRKLALDNDAAAQMYWLSRTWNAWAHGEKLSKLQEPHGGFTDPFPKLHRPR